MVKQSCEIILGTYEQFLVGLKFNKKLNEIQRSFTTHAHFASIRCLAQGGTFLASGGADDKIIIIDLYSRKEEEMLTHHETTVNCLQFTKDNTHIISGSQDGLLAIVNTETWEVEKTWMTHNGNPVFDIALHPSNKLAISLGGDYILRTWNLIKGRLAYAVNLNSKYSNARSLFGIRWDEEGKRFILIGYNNTDIWSIDTGGIIKSIVHERKVVSCVWHTNEHILVGYEDGNLGHVDVETGLVELHKVHEGRVKCLATYNGLIITGSSDGIVKVWNSKFKELCHHKTGCRLTSIVIAPLKFKIEEDCDETTTNIETVAEEDSIDVETSMKNVVVKIEEEVDSKKVKKSKVEKEDSTKIKKSNVVTIEKEDSKKMKKLKRRMTMPSQPSQPESEEPVKTKKLKKRKSLLNKTK